MKEVVLLDIKGMHCPNCPAKVERSVLKMEGIKQVKVDYDTESGSVIFDNNLTGVQQIINRIGQMGFDATESHNKNLVE
ncbi:heavy-metal-associated domain-containing protein [Piscibacillus halophilus]|uniref:Cu+-exporting ATPase n=1 Tax=Piscibacillus halophilus TaxID=571933 RepID=A0A1H9JV28_9BACI|nr:heavy metal-associated domain-containing protein [Piscibacillus halophilus]SEQ90680.1 Cu+-exporting ATPase [Piscibacillus halophilus]